MVNFNDVSSGDDSEKRFLAAYDVGKEGFPLFIFASSEEEILQKYPELEIVRDWPDWLEGRILEAVENEDTYRLSDAPSGLLALIVRNRNRNEKR